MGVSKYAKLLEKILQGRSDSSISFFELCKLLKKLGFEERISGSHHLFRKSGFAEKPNLQKDGNKAKSYQVRQVRQIILKHRMGEEL